MKKLLSKYRNGNYNVAIFDDGTKIRYNNLDCLVPEFPESMDVKISNYCPFRLQNVFCCGDKDFNGRLHI